MHKIFWVSLSAALLAARLSGAAETTYGAELDRIEELVDRGNWVELRGFLRARPDLVEGDDAFSRELQNFLGQTSGLYSALIIDQVKYPDVKSAKLTSTTDSALRTSDSIRRTGAGDGGISDSLLEAELEALKGPSLPDDYAGVPIGSGDGDPLLKAKQGFSTAASGDEAEAPIEVAALEPTRSLQQTAARGGPSRDTSDDDFEDSEPDAAVTSARDSGPSIY